MEGLISFREALEGVSKEGGEVIFNAELNRVKEVKEGKLSEEQARQERIEREEKAKQAELKMKEKQLAKEKAWTAKEMATLIKAVKLFPGGAVGRWERIADFVNEHGGETGGAVEESRKRSAQECIQATNQVRAGQLPVKEELNAPMVPQPVLKVPVGDVPTVRYEVEGENITNNTPIINGDKSTSTPIPSESKESSSTSWTSSQQADLEAALRKFPTSLFKSNPSARWDAVAKELNRPRKEIVMRIKELQDLVKKKKSSST